MLQVMLRQMPYYNFLIDVCLHKGITDHRAVKSNDPGKVSLRAFSAWAP